MMQPRPRLQFSEIDFGLDVRLGLFERVFAIGETAIVLEHADIYFVDFRLRLRRREQRRPEARAKG